ncbi:unknown [Cercopithecine alphaherpesvirus 9]|uniref:Envelope glycoprotein K n=1 Tax=Cercopithecine herpesvirus 9 (strain DHV) TaxID=36348 RepID=Q9E211_CHV9D|nr:envelope glycoprotein K [Cercopithecine alphaherpesvirus 9]AAG27224.1 unknown [Cercopithecine alphaherpesvirus 9]
MQALGIKTEHFIIVCLLMTYLLFVLWYTSRIQFRNVCVYATAPVQGGKVIWNLYNSSLIYVTVTNHSLFLDGLSGYDDSCRKDLINGDSILPTVFSSPLHEKIRVVLGTRNCRAYMWCVHLKIIIINLFVYAVYLQCRRVRRMFGPFRKACEFISPMSYSLQYTTSVISTTFLKFPYNKLTKLLHEVESQRNAISSMFMYDPISFLCLNKLIGLLIAFEIFVHIISGCVLLTLGIVYTPCSLLYPLYVRIVAWMFTGLIFGVEMVACVRSKSNNENNENNGSTVNPKGLHGVCTACCATVISGLAVKCIYVAVFAIAVIVFMHYEQRVQVSLFWHIR